MTKDDFNDALVAYNTAMAGDNLPPSESWETVRKRWHKGLKPRNAAIDRIRRELREREDRS